MAAEGHVALVTGASRGIGRAIALALGEAGARVLAASRDREACAAVAEAVRTAGGEARALALDVTDPASVAAAAVEARAAGSVDWLVNDAGIVESAPLEKTDDALYERHLAVNFHGARRVAEAFLPAMRERGHGRVVNVASSAGLRGYPYVAAYCASKFALVGWTLAAAAELAGSGVTVNAVCPHYVDSPMLDASVERVAAKTGRGADEAREYFRRQNPGGRLVTPAEVARAVLDLLQGEATGLLVELDGTDEPRVHRPNPGTPRPVRRSAR